MQYLIEHLRSQNVELALVSSSPRGIIDQVLKRFRLTECFSEIISGDEVSRAKPSPDIYEAIQRRFSGKKIYVIEDSPLGIASACAAGLDVIAFGPSSNHQKSVLYQCQSMDEVYQASEEILSSAEVVTMFKHHELRFHQEAWPLTAEQRKRVEKIWDRAKVEDSALFSGPVTIHRSHSQHDKFLYIDCVEVDYKIVLAHLRGDDLGMTVTPLGVSGILVDARGRTLLGRRNSVTEYRGWYELVPSGALSGQRTEDQLRQELVEETGMDPGVITAIDPFCLILDERHQVYDIGCRIDVDLELSADTRKSRGEYENLQWVDLAPGGGLPWISVMCSYFVGSLGGISVAVFLTDRCARLRQSSSREGSCFHPLNCDTAFR